MAFFRGQDKISRLASFVIGDGPSPRLPPGTNIGTSVDFSLGTVELQANILVVGRVQANNGDFSNAPAIGNLSFRRGTIDVNSLQIGFNPLTNHYAVGIVNVGDSGKLVVNDKLDLGKCVSGRFETRQNKGVLNIDGGSVLAGFITADYVGTNNTIAMTNGTLVVSNTMGPGICNFSMVNSTLQLPCAGTPMAMVNNLITGGTSNILNIGSLAWLASFPTQLAVIKYSGSIGGAGFNFALGSFPSGNHSYTGYLSNNTANTSVDLVLSSFSASQPALGAHAAGTNFEIDVTGDPGRIVQVLESTNLVDWNLFVTLTNSTGKATLFDPMTNLTRRFYRAKQVE